MSQRPTDEQLGDLLKTPHFGQSAALPASDPIVPTPMLLTLKQIKPYDRNPRRERNPRYDEIKESIRAQGGLNNQISVTRRPGEEIYMVESGGNTRLQILNELYEETGQETFNQIHVLYQPWKAETHVLAAHLIENDKRGEMLFIDKALGIRALKDLFEAELENGPLSIRQLVDRLREAGYSVDANLLSRMNYAIDVLLPVIPEALRAGMGRPQIARIRKIEKAFLQYWTGVANQDETIFSDVFQNCLAENNRPEWDTDALRDTLEAQIIDLIDVSTRELRLDIDALLRGREIESPPPEEEASFQPATTPQATSVESDNASTSESSENTSSESSLDIPTTVTTPQSESHEDGVTHSSSIGTNNLDEDEDDELEDEVSFNNIAEVRSAIHDTAYQLASVYQLEPCIHASPDWGLGFLIDLPDHPVISENNHELSAKERWHELVRQWIWWILYICSEETARPERIPNLPESMTIRQLCLKGDQNELMRVIGQPTWISLSYQLLADPLIPDEHFHLLVTLIRQCRTLRQKTEDTNDDPLWLERNDHA